MIHTYIYIGGVIHLSLLLCCFCFCCIVVDCCLLFLDVFHRVARVVAHCYVQLFPVYGLDACCFLCFYYLSNVNCLLMFVVFIGVDCCCSMLFCIVGRN